MASNSATFLHIILGYLLCLVTDVDPNYIRNYRQVKQDSTQDMKQDMPKCITQDGRDGFCLIYYLCKKSTDGLIFNNEGENVIQPKMAPKNSDQCPDFKDLPRRCCRNPNETQSVKLPWSVALFSTNQRHYPQNKINGYFCSGSLIHPKLVLSAAHCFNNRKPSGIQALVGAYNFDDDNEHSQMIEVTQIIKHKDYYDGNRSNDIALLVLNCAAELNEYVGTVSLPDQNSIALDDSECYASGWGRDINDVYPSMLAKTQKQLYDFEKCKIDYKNAFRRRVNLPANSFCAISLKLDKCEADDGSPFVCKVKNTKDIYVQYGVMAISPCRKYIVAVVYADLRLSRNWIDTEVKELGYSISSYTYSG